MTAWPLNAPAEAGNVSTVMLCTAEMSANPLCVAIYSGFGVKAGVGRRAGSQGQPDLVYMGLTGSAACQGVTDLGCHAIKDGFNWILDENVHTITRIVVVGTPVTIKAAIAQTLQAFQVTTNRAW